MNAAFACGADIPRRAFVARLVVSLHRDPQWGVLRGCAVNECFTVGAFEVKFDVSKIKAREHGGPLGGRQAPERTAVRLAVFDGHGGDAVSSFLAARFSETLFERASNDETGETGAGRIAPAALLRRDRGVAARPPRRERSWLGSQTRGVPERPRSGEHGGGGAVALTETNPRAFVASSATRGVAADEHGTVVFETVDQRPNRAGARAGRSAGPCVVGGVARAAGVLAVSRAFGNAGIKACVKADPSLDARAGERRFGPFGLSGPGGKDGARPPPAMHTVILCSTASPTSWLPTAPPRRRCPRGRRGRASARARRRERSGELERVHVYPASILLGAKLRGERGGHAGPGGAGPDAGGADGWWGSRCRRRADVAGEDAPERRQRVLVPRAPLGNEPPALEAAEDGQRRGNHAGQDAGRDDAAVGRPAKTPVKTPSKSFEDAFEVAFEVAGETPQRTPGSARDAKREGGRGARKPDGGRPAEHAVAPSVP